MGLYVCTDEKAPEAGKGQVDQHDRGNGAGEHAPVCVHCGSPVPAPNQVAFDGFNIWLHRECEAEYRREDPLDIPRFLRRA